MAAEKKAFDDWMKHFACDDPYWKVPARYMDPSRLERFFSKFDKFEETYPKWVDDLYSSLPTYYCMLCVSRTATAEELKRAYERKKKHSFYPPELIERAYDALNTPTKRATYDKVLNMFLKITQGSTPVEKREMIEHHDEGIELEKEHASWEYVKENRRGWFILFHLGAPTFYEVLGVASDAVIADLETKAGTEIDSKSDNGLKEKIRDILKNPQLRFEYDIMLDFMDVMLDDDDLDEIEERREEWGGKDEFYLLVLDRYDSLQRYGQIRNAHLEWENYIDENTFYDVLNMDSAAIPGDKREAESFIRSAYKVQERTPEVNLAYSVLKNSRLRADYDWLLRNKQWTSKLHELDIANFDESQVRAIREGFLCV
ncbi:MAG: hypothetical protein U9R10_01230 [Euryarchaeota archaeon]|nr:hypothetical protein [Euryarchaeota archaeon]